MKRKPVPVSVTRPDRLLPDQRYGRHGVHGKIREGQGTGGAQSGGGYNRIDYAGALRQLTAHPGEHMTLTPTIGVKPRP